MSTDIFGADFKGYQEKIASSLIAAVKNANAVAAEDLSFHRNVSDNVSKSLDKQNTFLLKLTSRLLGAVTKDTSMKAPNLKTLDDVYDKWKPSVDVIDTALEKADVYMDEYNGGITRNTPQSSTPEPAPSKPRPVTTPHHLPYTGNMAKPQKKFNRQVNNYDNSTWKPLLAKKPHAILPFEDSLVVEHDVYKHPYEHEIKQYRYPERVYQESEPIPYTSPDTNQPIWVDTEEGVRTMLEELKLAPEIAVDLEHNDRNSYVGLVSLMQISTRDKDWVVDTLQPWRENLQVLNEVFANPAILKVFHGSASDMVWLQRDLGIYVVGLFDTYWAANALSYRTKSLAFLLQHFCNFAAQKQYQMADWRIRPLPQELLDYARSDTHYLLYIYDNMRNELIQASSSEENLLDTVLQHSNDEALQVYERRPYDHENGLGSEGWLKILAKMPGNISKEQFGILKSLHEWRDSKAREADEGTSSIMTNRFLLGCVERPPVTVAQFYNAQGLGRASTWVLNNSAEVLDTIERGKRDGNVGPSVQEVLERNEEHIAKLRRWHTPKPEKKTNGQNGVAETMRRLIAEREANGEGNPTEPLAGRINTSSFWGHTTSHMFASNLDLRPAEIALESIRPIGTFANITVSKPSPSPAIDEQTASTQQDRVNGQPRIIEEPAIDVPFTLRAQNKKKRAADLIEDDENMVSTNVQHSDKFAITDEGKVTRYSDARRAFKSRDNLEKQAEAAAFEPFDYANAQSMLHAKNNPADGVAQNTTKPFNPFAKALDTSTGAKRNRMGKELAGRSHTFKS